MLRPFSSYEYWDSALCDKNDGIERRNDDESGGQSFVPLVCDGIIEMQQIPKDKIGYGDEYDMEANDDQGTNREIGDDIPMDSA